ncbi:MAG TPA: hypothetical protein VND21_06145, partial [Planctomycetota bacterium]|nr:hypothetical protein [Planctomycetota bacterium]
VHRHNATPEQLSADALKLADTGIWSGCYAASLSCRYAITRDPESLALVRRLAAGLDLLSKATGKEGCLSRAVGRPIPGESPGKDTRRSPLGGGLMFRDDPSRDTLSGVVLGWTMMARLVDDPEVRATASRNLGAIARRLAKGGMKVRDVDWDVTKHGQLDPKVALVVENGVHAAIGCAAILAGQRYSPGEDLDRAWRRLEKDGWVDSIDSQHTWIDTQALDASNVQMSHLALVVVALEGTGRARSNAMRALRDLRRHTKRWQNGALLALFLLAGGDYDRADAAEDLRTTLLAMRPEEVEWKGTTRAKQRHIVPIERRPVSTWLWKEDADHEEMGYENAVPHPDRTVTRADWLFAYWLGRASGAMSPGM